MFCFQSVFVMTKAFVATLKTEDGMKSASIINISSLAGKVVRVANAKKLYLVAELQLKKIFL